MVKLLRRWLPVMVWCGIIFYFSHRPVPPSFSEEETFKGIDLIYHFLTYAFLGFLYFRAHAHFTASLIFVWLYGASDEIHQYFLVYRSFEISDIVMDVLGGGMGAIVFKRAAKMAKWMDGKSHV